MNEQLEQALAKLIEKALNGIDAAGDFMAGEIPDVVNQLLIWHAVESFIWFLLWLASSIWIAMIIKKNHSSLIDELEGGGEPIFLVVYGVPASLLMLSLSKIEWLKILIAPKLYLLEYAAKIVG